ncbi:hypothetical protein G9A89_003128 [Geosiphon pyriformis]|nr:hypothetical protein G9A89_003128 [Geosiphon pyriformis]
MNCLPWSLEYLAQQEKDSQSTVIEAVTKLYTVKYKIAQEELDQCESCAPLRRVLDSEKESCSKESLSMLALKLIELEKIREKIVRKCLVRLIAKKDQTVLRAQRDNKPMERLFEYILIALKREILFKEIQESQSDIVDWVAALNKLFPEIKDSEAEKDKDRKKYPFHFSSRHFPSQRPILVKLLVQVLKYTNGNEESVSVFGFQEFSDALSLISWERIRDMLNEYLNNFHYHMKEMSDLISEQSHQNEVVQSMKNNF